MNTDTAHFSRSSSHHVHLDVHFDDSMRLVDDVYPALQRIIVETQFHFAHLQGQVLTSAQQIRRAIAEAYQFPTFEEVFPLFEEDFPLEHYYDVVNWDGIAEWMGDLGRFHRKPTASKRYPGFLCFYSDPEHFFVRDPVEFARCLRIISQATAFHNTKNNPFHIVISPVNIHMLYFIEDLRVQNYICPDCLNQATDKYIYIWE